MRTLNIHLVKCLCCHLQIARCLMVLVSIHFIFACESKVTSTKQEQDVKIAAESASAEELAKQYCQSCHQFPEPSLLDKNSWNNVVLPRMGYFMGIYESTRLRDSLIEQNKGGELVKMANTFPERPLIDQKKWGLIKSYYLSHAPDELKTPKPADVQIGLKHFKIRKPSFKITPPSTTLVKFSDKGRSIYIGDAHSKSLLEFDAGLNLIKRGMVNEGAVCLKEFEDEIWLTTMGSFSPSDNPSGFVLNIPRKGAKSARILMDMLRRPVHSAYGDLNNDGRIDAVISEFGKWTGRLNLYTGNADGTFKQRTLLNRTGAIRSYLKDFNGDGLLDIIALFGQGNEGINIFYNQGESGFKMEEVLQFSPSNGSAAFHLVDYNNDGHEDILYIAGDNADFKPVMKPYHGIYLFENDGKNNFSEVLFYHLNGAYDAVMKDFDMDGDLDIAAISFFPDFGNGPVNTFLFLENSGDFEFKTSSFEHSNRGRWIVMDHGDMDDDGDIDLILGALAFEVVPKNDSLENHWIKEGLPFVVLENTIK